MIRYVTMLLLIGLAWGQDCTADDGTDGVEVWGECYSIENANSLDLSASGLTGEIPSQIGSLTNLTSLNLYSNQLSGSIPSEIGNLINLNDLYLQDNQLTGEIPESICNLNLDWGNGMFDISYNQLCPPYPSCIEDYVEYQDTNNCGECDENSEVELWGQNYSVENTTSLNLNNSGLTGSIPPEIGCLSNLTKLELQNNQLTGEIPSQIGNLTNLTRLWLFDNELTGEIPDSICSLVENNCNINISNNQLCPPYPSCIEDVGVQDTSGCAQVSIINETLPITYNLYNAYPNPFNPKTTLHYDLPEDGFVNITIYDMMGRVVSNLVSSQQNAGYKSIQWNATNVQGQPVSAGVYLYSIEAGEFRQTKKMILLK